MRVLGEEWVGDESHFVHYDEFFVELLVNHLCQTISSLQELVPESSRPVDPRGAARAIVGMIESFAYGIFIGGEDYSLDLVVDTLTHFCVSAIAVPAFGALDLED